MFVKVPFTVLSTRYIEVNHFVCSMSMYSYFFLPVHVYIHCIYCMYYIHTSTYRIYIYILLASAASGKLYGIQNFCLLPDFLNQNWHFKVNQEPCSSLKSIVPCGLLTVWYFSLFPQTHVYVASRGLGKRR